MRGHQAVAFRTAFTITGDAAEAEDAAQEAFVKVYHTLERFRSGAPFRPWLLTVVANEARNRRRAAGRRLNLTLRAAEHGSQGAPPSPETRHRVSSAELRTRLPRDPPPGTARGGVLASPQAALRYRLLRALFLCPVSPCCPPLPFGAGRSGVMISRPFSAR